jgi:hypothetical protein
MLGEEKPEVTKELSESEFIHEEYSHDPKSFWLALLLFFVVVVGIWGIKRWEEGAMQGSQSATPFTQVTNRELSLFLWQYPQLSRNNASSKSSYLPGFYAEQKMGIKQDYADEFAIAPPELFFLYHTWKRQLGDFVVPRTFSEEIWTMFLEENREWIGYDRTQKEVQQAILGWYNINHEIEKILAYQTTDEELSKLLTQEAHFARNYWRNIYPTYLKEFTNSEMRSEIPENELPSFLKIALYNRSL